VLTTDLPLAIKNSTSVFCSVAKFSGLEKFSPKIFLLTVLIENLEIFPHFHSHGSGWIATLLFKTI
jgi:hypothetical protein